MRLFLRADPSHRRTLSWHGRTLPALGLLIAAATPAGAWSNHALCTWPALSVLPAVAQAAPVKVESLSSFLAAESAALAPLLREEEQWARDHVPTYPPRPDALAFEGGGASGAELQRRFLAAVRVNPESRTTLYLQLPPGQSTNSRPVRSEGEITTLKRNETTKSNVFVALKDGDQVPPIDVVATASDEPDHGLDIGLWEDSGTAYGRDYKLGKQPFGNPAIEFASQAPLHMGFFHEAAIVYKAAPFLQRTYPEYRIHLWQTLAVHAFRSGHPYWGWRFAGWSLHYLQDLTQPYHATVLPGVGVASMLWINALDLAGFHGAKERAVALVSNRHLALENYQFQRLRSDWLRGDFGDAPIAALKDTSRDAGRSYTDASPRATITKESNEAAAAIDAILERQLPAKYVSDPAYVFGETESGVDLYAVVNGSGAPARAAMTEALVRLLGSFGSYTRAFVRSLPVASP